jgi:hypothetical protein
MIPLARLHVARVLLVVGSAFVALANQMLLGAMKPRPGWMRIRGGVASVSLVIGDKAQRLARRVAPG